MLKFPMFEVINTTFACTSLHCSLRGVATGAVFSTIVLPLTNFRIRRSLNLPIRLGQLYQAYQPTIVRDIAYGWSRCVFGGFLTARSSASSFSIFGSEFLGACLLFGLAVLVSCIVSSPMNEWRGFVLQPSARRLPFKLFFKLERWALSTGMNSVIVAFSLAVGMGTTPIVRQLFAVWRDNTVLVTSCAAGVLISLQMASNVQTALSAVLQQLAVRRAKKAAQAAASASGATTTYATEI
jgi:hypothetical protein